MGINVGTVVRYWALQEPSRTALVLAGDTRSTCSYGELDLRARRVAAKLRAQGLAEGDRVALCAANGLSFVAAWFGALYAGLTVLPLPPMSAPRELSQRLAHAKVRAIVSDLETRALVHEARQHGPHVLELAAETLSEHPAAVEAPVDLAPNSVAMILYTSGTTGSPKGAMITHASLMTHTAALVHHALTLSADDLVLACLPLSHSYGIRMTLLAPFFAGARSVLIKRFHVERVRALCRAEGVTWFPGVPTMFHALAHEQTVSPHDFPALRWALSAGAPLPSRVREQAERALGAKVRQGFGLTEATFSTISRPDDPAGADTVGRAVFGVEVRIIDAQGNPVPPGSAGEICVRGQNVMAGYLDDPEATALAMRDGWLHSGDIGVLDPEGRLTVVDRIKDMIIRGGFNVYPAEVEAVLVAHPHVRNAVVVGRPDEHYGEEVVAVIVLEPGAELDVADLDAFCRARLGRTKLPRLYGTLEALPLGPSGKVQRREVRALVERGQVPLISHKA